MHKSVTKCNETLGKWCKNKHGASKIIDTLETYHLTGSRKKKIVTDNRYTCRAQKNSSPICPDLISAAPNDDARNKNALLEVRSVVILGSGKRP
jgi:hypothetical protein